MQYRTMKKTGDKLSVLGFGCMRLPEKNRKIDKKRAASQIYDAIDRGINYLDTAFPYHYGQSEPFIGEIIDSQRREKVKLATKLPPVSVRSRKDMDKILNAQLQRMKTDRIDYYMLHGIERESWNKFRQLDVLEFLDKAKSDGRIINAGFSFHGDIATFKEIIDSYDWHFCQIQYNFLDENMQAGKEGLDYAAAKEIGIIVMEPLRGGTLTGNIPNQVRKIWGEAKIQRSPAEWALRWTWNHPEVTVVLSGMNEEAHIDENIRVANEALPCTLGPDELVLFERVKQTYQELLEIGCTGCRYCMPCPEGVDIPMCFDLYNRVTFFEEVKLHNMLRYAMHLGGMGKKDERAFASQCVHCGECLEHCPQELPIPELLEKVDNEFETPLLRFFMLYARFFFARARRRGRI